ncbi:uncharacterized protein LOC108674908 [Hyalella azteca]|uniref:Uncharacterized protein LOC108674908 n=1 Tax=Hyalella azteca TaxID=294128 RepID=A0A8B7NXA5_HYAAZ|nr:uncharacterized protein LOC108674908 [Hyalella azteca]XP_018018377.1 uncharacterized protein LOC108674908 [Hyalella azteca]
MQIGCARTRCTLRLLAVFLSVLKFTAGLTTQANIEIFNTHKALGQCPTFTPLSTLTKTDIVGIWHVYQQSDNSLENSWTCKNLVYSAISNDFTYNFRVNNLATSYTGTYGVNTAGAGIISVALRYQLALGADSFGNVNQFVVAADATKYLIIRACTNFGLFNQQYVYVLTRQTSPDASTITAINTALATAGVQAAQLYTVTQTGCT